MAEARPLLRLSQVSKRYDSPDGAPPITILDGISLELQSGETLAIVGPSGSGKSTLLHVIGTLDQPTSGEVILNGQNLAQLGPDDLAAIRNRQIGFVFQSHFLLPQCTVLENVLVPTLAKAGQASTLRSAATEDGSRLSISSKSSARQEVSPETVATRARRLLERVGLGARLGHRPGQLSGGERQRVAVVRALINQPQLLLADEPTGSLDHLSAVGLAQLLTELNREEKVALVVVTHSPELAQLMGRVLALKDGRLSSE